MGVTRSIFCWFLPPGGGGGSFLRLGLVAAACFSVLGCATTPTDLRAIAPAETLIYLETNDLAAALQPIVDSDAFVQAAKSKPDLSAVKGVQVAVAVTGFETTEEKLTEEHSIGSVQPRFVAIIDTHAWNWQAIAFTDKNLGQFVTDAYGDDLTQEREKKNDGERFTWTANDGRRSFAHVTGGLVIFSNDETALDKCLVVRRGEADSIAKTGKIKPAGPATLASGYLSTDGVAQVASIAGLSFGKSAADEPEVQSAVAGLLPQLLRGAITEVSWSASKTDAGLEDVYDVELKPDVSAVFAETIVARGDHGQELEEFVPANAMSVTKYDLADPQVAWRSLLLTSVAQTDAMGGRIVTALSSGIFDTYGIEDPEVFLSAIGGGPIVTVKLDQEGDEVVVIARTKIADLLKRSISKDIDLSQPPAMVNEASIWRSEDGEIAAAFRGEIVILGEADSVLKCLEANANKATFKDRKRVERFESARAAALTIGNEVDEQGGLVEVLSERKDPAAVLKQRFLTATTFDRSGMHRRTLSDFGLIGSIAAGLGAER